MIDTSWVLSSLTRPGLARHLAGTSAVAAPAPVLGCDGIFGAHTAISRRRTTPTWSAFIGDPTGILANKTVAERLGSCPRVSGVKIDAPVLGVTHDRIADGT